MKLQRYSCIAGFVGVLALAPFVSATPVTVANAGFELNTGVGGFPPPTNWTQTSGTGLFTENTSVVGSPDADGGTKYAGTDSGLITQDLGVTFLANTIYTVTLSVGNRGSLNGDTVFGLQSSSSVGTYLGTATTIDQTTITVGTWKDFTYTFTTTATPPTGDVVAAWSSATGASGSARAVANDYRVDASPVPEPAMLGLLGLASASLLGRRRKA